VAEAAKVIENTQRDLNIALMNELSLIFERMGIDTLDVLAAAGTKWNFLPFRPGLVGGHCIGVDPYYLTHKASILGYIPEVILAGRRINDGMGHWIAQQAIKTLLKEGGLAPCTVTVLGITFKENVPDHRNTRVVDMVAEFRDFGARVQVHDPLADRDAVAGEYGIELTDLEALAPAHAVVVAVPHGTYREGSWGLVARLLEDSKGLVVDVRGCLDRNRVPDGIRLWRL
jgi:UDP-N-acetyl-D-galactosamine dehydrogenase